MTPSIILRQAGLLAICAGTAMGQGQAADAIWRDIPRPIGFMAVVPASARLIGANVQRLTARLSDAPVDTGAGATRTGLELFLPAPPGYTSQGYVRVRVHESPVLPANLASRFPNFRTYFGRGLDDPSITTRFEVTPAGLRGIVSSARGEFLIEPRSVQMELDIRPGDVPHAAVPKAVARQMDTTTRRETVVPRRPPGPGAARRPDNLDPSGRELTVRLAVVATREYSEFHRRNAPTDAAARDSALLSLARTINLVQRPYQVDLGVRFVLVPQQASLVFVGTDPFPARGLTQIRKRNQHVIDSIVGRENYDLGHVLTTTAGGEAVVGSICDSTTKAQGLSGLRAPVEAQPFAIDYVAHEIGHQFGANHTFNAVVKACKDQRHVAAATEPGSGSTIMSYAGICPPLNIQTNADSYFHIVSLAEIADVLGSVSCLGSRPNGNRSPVVTTARRDVFVPVSTPFMLIGSATDPDGDSLVFTWEEVPGLSWAPSAMPPEGDSDGNIRPLFRSYPPSPDTIRYLPSLALQARGMPVPFEALPSRRRQDAHALEFQFTARDQRGGIATAATTVHVVGERPFKVTGPASTATWRSQSPVRITWDVGSTAAAPISCGAVDIRLSTDGGRSYPISLGTNLINDGAVNLTLGNVPKSQAARVMVMCSQGTFFSTSATFAIR